MLRVSNTNTLTIMDNWYIYGYIDIALRYCSWIRYTSV